MDDTGSGTTITTQIHVELQQQVTGLSGKIGRVEDTDVVYHQERRTWRATP